MKCNIIMKRKYSRLIYTVVCPSGIQLKCVMPEQCQGSGAVINGCMHSTGRQFKLHCAELQSCPCCPDAESTLIALKGSKLGCIENRDFNACSSAL